MGLKASHMKSREVLHAGAQHQRDANKGLKHRPAGYFAQAVLWQTV